MNTPRGARPLRFGTLVDWARRAGLWRYLASVWTIAILVTVFVPGRYVPGSHLFELDKLIHLIMFLGFSILWLSALPRRFLRIALSGAALGVMTEVGQAVLPFGRTGDILDVVANAAGLLLGLTIMFAIRSGRKKTP